MTPHGHWHYKPLHIPVHLADQHCIYSWCGVGSMVFEPVLEGKKVSRAVELTRVLHVPRA
ncbi:hypothetical protein FA15DRAFT_602844 [Coprinopsis marcescibilis]|uniref:Uncharacterized protein n=1 Tax=Coprinopsis marcescibilis TaxID=230819 RepID=A0A5C3KSD3_COPMA|nr:hypothetical protein FA15DRAFT_602844 [Coprinopsis marcescibilis]